MATLDTDVHSDPAPAAGDLGGVQVVQYVGREDPVVLYVLVRTDMATMTPGRVAAQACHAANQCVSEIRSAAVGELDGFVMDRIRPLLDEWEAQTGHGFGLTIVLDGGRGEDIVRAVDSRPADHLGVADAHGGLVWDPTYPIGDGEVTHTVGVTTCGFVFGRKSVAGNVVAGFGLYSG